MSRDLSKGRQSGGIPGRPFGSLGSDREQSIPSSYIKTPNSRSLSSNPPFIPNDKGSRGGQAPDKKVDDKANLVGKDSVKDNNVEGKSSNGKRKIQLTILYSS